MIPMTAVTQAYGTRGRYNRYDRYDDDYYRHRHRHKEEGEDGRRAGEEPLRLEGARLR